MKNKHEIVVHLDGQRFTKKPSNEIIGKISNRITKNLVRISLKDFSYCVGEKGQAFTRALFRGKRSADFFEEQVLFAVDIDEGLSYQEFMKRSELYKVKASRDLYTLGNFSISEFRESICSHIEFLSPPKVQCIAKLTESLEIVCSGVGFFSFILFL